MYELHIEISCTLIINQLCVPCGTVYHSISYTNSIPFSNPIISIEIFIIFTTL